MKISVITVCLNAAQTIRHTLESFHAQDYADKELVVIDGESTDATVAIVKEFLSDHVVLVSAPDQGLYDAMNKGLKIFSGDAVGMLNADDRFHDRSILSRIARGLNEADLVSGHLDYVQDHQTRRLVRRWRGRAYWPHAFKFGWTPAHPTFYVRRRVVETVGPYNIAYKISADYDWMLRSYEIHNFKESFIDHVMVDMMAGGKSAIGIGSLAQNIDALRVRQKWLQAGVVDYALFARPLRKLGQFVFLDQS